jgi:cation transport ATPase|tara:strand:+ start:105 stop:494 length:390 start_codon:yes stop_codon:yes gene_type:complete
MKILEKLFGETASGIANIVDRFVQTKEEKHEANKEIQKLFQNFEIEMQKNTTERWKYDSNSDSWLSKNIRPIVLLILVISTILLVFVDAGVLEFDVKESWVDLLQIVLITVIGAYFGSRGLEKYKKNGS